MATINNVTYLALAALLALAACGQQQVNTKAYAPKSAEASQEAAEQMAALFDRACIEQLSSMETAPAKTRAVVDEQIVAGWTPVRYTPVYSATDPVSERIVMHQTAAASGLGVNQCMVSEPGVSEEALPPAVRARFQQRGITVTEVPPLEGTTARTWQVPSSVGPLNVIFFDGITSAGTRQIVALNWE